MRLVTLVAFGAGKRRIVDAEGHRQGRRIDRLRRQRRAHLGRADGVRNGGVGQAGDGDDVAGGGLVETDALEPAKGEHLGHAALLDQLAVWSSTLTGWFGAIEPEVMRPVTMRPRYGIGLENGAEQAERALLDLAAGRHGRAPGRTAAACRDPSGPRRSPPSSLLSPSRRESGSRAARREASSAANRSNTSFTTSAGRASGRSTLLITTIGFSPIFSALDTHELGLRQRTFGGVDQHQRAIDHVEDALDLAAEIGVARRVDDVDAGALPEDRGHLGENGDAALALEIVGIHRALGHPLVLAEEPDCCSRRSTRVVLPWSTWAMMAILRRCMGA